MKAVKFGLGFTAFYILENENNRFRLISSDSEEARTYYHYASDNLGSITDVMRYM